MRALIEACALLSGDQLAASATGNTHVRVVVVVAAAAVDNDIDDHLLLLFIEVVETFSLCAHSKVKRAANS